MTWLAVLLYAGAAVLAGSFFTALAFYLEAASSWALEDRRLSGFALVYGLTLVAAAPTQLVYAGLLRFLTQRLQWHRGATWAAAGGVLGIAVPWVFARAGYFIDGLYFSATLQPLKSVLMFPLLGPMMYEIQPIWVRAAVGAATAVVLRLVVRRVHALGVGMSCAHPVG